MQEMKVKLWEVGDSYAKLPQTDFKKVLDVKHGEAITLIVNFATDLNFGEEHKCCGKSQKVERVRKYLVIKTPENVIARSCQHNNERPVKIQLLDFLEDCNGFLEVEETAESKKLAAWIVEQSTVNRKKKEIVKSAEQAKSSKVCKQAEPIADNKKIVPLPLSVKPAKILSATPGFKRGLNSCFKNAALKQLLLEPNEGAINLKVVSSSVKPLATTYNNLSESFRKVRQSLATKSAVDTSYDLFIKELSIFVGKTHKYLDEDETAAYRQLRGTLKHSFQAQEDAKEFADSLCVLFKLYKPENVLYRRQRYVIASEKLGLNGEVSQSDSSSFGAYFFVYPKGKSLSQTLSEEICTGATTLELTRDGKMEKLPATLYESVSCDAIDSITSLRIAVGCFGFPDIRKPKEAQLLLNGNNDIVPLCFRKKIEIKDGCVNGYMGADVHEFKANFKVNTVVFHIGLTTVHSGHYITLENLGGDNWIVHDDSEVYSYVGTLTNFIHQNRKAVPYMFNLVKV
ncbi:hypothetical protein SOPP22_16380 [Shewanella sp. OPT22]|nr:hypothetical protein SOPP22_16380 [Shewanella sp. OPT22]